MSDKKDLQEKIYEIRKDGIGSNYFNLEVIKHILAYDNNISWKENIIERLNKLYEEVWQADYDLHNTLKEYDNSNRNVIRGKNNYMIFKNDVRKRTISFLITLAIIAGGGFGGGIYKSSSTKYINSTFPGADATGKNARASGGGGCGGFGP